MKDTEEINSGVQQLIDKLKHQGVVAGEKQAEQIIKDAQKKASDILTKAELEADKLLSDTRGKLESERKSSHEAIKTAFRDTELALRSKLREAFSTHLGRLVSLELEDKAFIKQLVLAIAGAKAAEAQAGNIEILVPAKACETDKEEALLSPEGKQKLQHLVLGITNDMLRNGIELKPSADLKGGIKVRLVGKDLEIDLTDEALTNLLLKYLLPRYREIVSGQIYEK